MRISDWSSDVCSSDLAARDHLRRELGADGERAIRYLATADALLLEGHVRSHLRFAESAIYNLREAFDSIVGGSDPVGDVSDRSEERRVGKECVSTFRSRGRPYILKKKKNQKTK